MKIFKSIMFWGILAAFLLNIALFFLLPVMGVREELLRWLIVLLVFVCILFFLTLFYFGVLFSNLKSSKRPPPEEASASLEKPWLDALEQETVEAIALINRAGRTVVKNSAKPLEHFRFFLVLGNNLSGKTSLLENNSLIYRSVYPTNKMISSRPMSFYKWRISTNSVYIEIQSPSFIQAGSTGAIDLDVYSEFLKKLKKHGKKHPVDGLILTVSLEDLKGRYQEIESLAAKLQESVTTTLHHLELDIPLYVTFTHCDIFPGFHEYFSELKGVAKEQILGATFSLTDQSRTPKQNFERQFGALCHQVAGWLFPTLNRTPMASKSKVFLFPRELEAAGPKLSRFIEHIFKQSLQGERPLFRGFFLTSIINEGSLLHSAAISLAGDSQTMISHPLNPHAQSQSRVINHSPDKEKAFFTGLLFQGLLENEKMLSRLPSRRKTKLSRKAALISFLFALCGAGILLYSITGLLKSQTLAKEIAGGIQSVKALDWRTEESFMVNYPKLDSFSEILTKIERFEKKDKPWQLPPGYFNTDEALSNLRKVYYKQIHDIFFSNLLRELPGELYYAQFQGKEEKKQLYKNLKLYLCITDMGKSHRKVFDEPELTRLLVEKWEHSLLETYGEEALPLNFTRSIENHAARYTSDLKSGNLPTDGLKTYQSDKPAIEKARQALRENYDLYSLYQFIEQTADSYKNLTLTDMGLSQDGALHAAAQIKGFYTKQAFKSGAFKHLEQAAEKPYHDDWVLGGQQRELPPEFRDKRKLVKALKDLYFQAYGEEWLNFLKSISTDIPQEMKPMAARLLQFSSETQGIRAVLKRVIEEVDLLIKKDKQVDKLIERKTRGSFTKRMIRKKVDIQPKNRVLLKKRFKPLESLLGTEGRKGLMKYYLDGMASLGDIIGEIAVNDDMAQPTLEFMQKVFKGLSKNPMVHCWRESESIAGQMPDEMKEWLKPLLQTMLLTLANNLTELTEKRLEDIYQNRIYSFFQQRLKDRYPLEKQGLREANLDDINAFFNRIDGIFTLFIKDNLEPFLKTSGGEISARQWNGVKVRLSDSALTTIGQGLQFTNRVFQVNAQKAREYPLMVTLYHNPNTASIHVRISDKNLEVDAATQKLKQRVSWPDDQAHLGTEIKVTLPNSKNQTLESPGPWGFLRLLDKTREFIPYSNGFTASWRIRVENKYDADIRMKGEIREAVNPFTRSDFYRFVCTSNLIEKVPSQFTTVTPE